jgi:hypothetical protein
MMVVVEECDGENKAGIVDDLDWPDRCLAAVAVVSAAVSPGCGGPGSGSGGDGTAAVVRSPYTSNNKGPKVLPQAQPSTTGSSRQSQFTHTRRQVGQ